MELLGYINNINKMNSYTIKELYENKIGIRITNEKDFIDFVTSRNNYNIRGCTINAWKKNLRYITEYGITVIFTSMHGTLFTASTEYYNNQGYNIKLYKKEVNILWSY